MMPNLQAEQARRGMTNQQVAEHIGLSRVSYEAKKRSGRFVTSECHILCALFDCDFQYLFATEPKGKGERS